MRVYEFAKQVNKESKEIIEILKDLGIEVKNHMSSIDDESIALIKKNLEDINEKGVKTEKKASKVKTKENKAKPGTIKAKTRKKEIKEVKIEEETEDEVPEEEKTPEVLLPEIQIVEGSTVKEFAEKIGQEPNKIIKTLMQMGEMASINQSLEKDVATLLAEEFGFKAKFLKPEEEEIEEFHDRPEDLRPKPPVVTIMGHVDHGKTKLLDAIKKSDIVSQEAGGITQHIGAYQIEHDSKKITFIDTPGHEAFTAMRARGAQITDIAVLVVAADDGVMPQTVEAIAHAKAAKVPILVAINKIDKSNANPDKVKKQLGEHELVAEDWGGDTVFVNVSAKESTNIDELLDMILLIAEIQELKSNPFDKAYGVVIEAKLDRARGPVATVLIQRGTIKLGDSFVAGLASGKVRAMVDEYGNKVDEATPGQPVEIIGISEVPKAGDIFKVMNDEKSARQIAEERHLKRRLLDQVKIQHTTLENLYERIKEGEMKELFLIIKCDTQGSIEAIKDSLEKMDQSEVKINILHSGVGGITETDAMLASASDAIIIGFNVRPDSKAKELAEKEKVDIKTYQVIYQIIEDINSARVGMLKPQYKEIEKGRVEIRELFKISKIGNVAGCFVQEGEITRKSKIRLVRDGKIIYDGKLSSLKRFKDDVNSVKAGFECGLTIEDFQDIKVGDIIEIYVLEEIPRE